MSVRNFALAAAPVLLALVASCAGPGLSQEAISAQPDTAPAIPATEWAMIEPGGDTLCATGTPFRFHVRGGDMSRVMLFLNGGGACWSGDHCDVATEPTPYTPFADMASNDPELLEGVFDSANAANPFAGWTQLFVPYCTGDSHLGSKDVVYQTSAGEAVTIHHRGKANVQAALDWLYANRPAAQRVFVTGGSAGGIGSPYYAGLVADQYPEAEIVQLADGSGGYRAAGIAEVLETWGAFEGTPDWPEFSALDRAAASTEDFFRVTAARHPEMQMARFDNVDDQVQQDFLGLLGTGKPVRELLAANNADLARDIPGIRTFSAPGDGHTALRFDHFYTEQTAGVRLSDWVRDLAEGRAGSSVSCETDSSCD
ncbi:putative lipoprotein [Hyphomonas neptunium ATCC 15444]|uniref:Putative lipoprotein n=2 Tax=Hyphomonas TaxID=85 RepID=Q0BZ23_HYPNA|nr:MULTISPECIES: pectin acetylesterase-family hydrolase [Hyphomonas]ABI78379.1 putative lipoprotein [Hyphomonas neptunium ATCC 15444]KCZ87266.1 putative lipoprotein [Hyphomonas hirschiana VP5]